MDAIQWYTVGSGEPLRSGVALTGAYGDGLAEAFLVIRGFEPLALIRQETSPRSTVRRHLDRLLGEAGVDLMEPVRFEPAALEAVRPLLEESAIRGAFRELLRQTRSRTLLRLEQGPMGAEWLRELPPPEGS
jgi:hypothetical protein